MVHDAVQKPVLLIGGKGGVGKTTCSAAIATRLAALGKRTLIITSDLSPSLSDIFERKIGDTITVVKKNLDAYEISPDAIVAHWKKRFGGDFYDILAHLINMESLDGESRHQLLDYIGSAPSLREETMLDIIVDMAGNRGYDRVVWDTAPAGETLNLLDMPSTIRRHLRAGARVFEGLDKIGKQLIKKRSIANIMDEWIALSERIARFIHQRSTFIIVANPEALVVSQVRRMVATLKEYDLPIHGLVINRVIENPDSSRLIAMQEDQARYIEELMNNAGERHVITLSLAHREIKGLRRLQEIGEELVTGLLL
jgi:arsenite-transporting ATPase